MFTRRNGAWFSSVALFNSHFWLPPATGPILIDTQLGSIKHITLQLPSFGTSALLIAWLFMAIFGIGSLNLMCRLSSSVVGKTNISFSFHSLEKISYFHWWNYTALGPWRIFLKGDSHVLKIQCNWEAFITKN